MDSKGYSLGNDTKCREREEENQKIITKINERDEGNTNISNFKNNVIKQNN